MTKKIFTAAIANVVAYFNQMPEEKMKALPTKMRWNIRRNLNKFIPIAKEFEDFRQEIIGDLQKDWFNDEKAEDFAQPKVDEKGEPVLDENGDQVTEQMKRIKEEYIEDYEKAVQDVNKKMNEILMEVNEVDILPIDLDDFVDKMDEDSPIQYEDLDILSVFTEEA